MGGAAPLRGPWPVDLAHTRPFRIGDVEIRPATREVVRAELREVLEPRVMEVLVVLAAADGTILSRDDLIAACWGGRAVTDDAISRVISRLRALGRTIGGFEVETITKVGYWLVSDGGAEPELPSPAAMRRLQFDRRSLVAGGLAAALSVGAAALLWKEPWRHRPHPEAEALFRRGALLSREGLPGQVQQTVSYFERAVAVDPDYAEAWGALALAYSHLLAGFDEAEAAGLPERIRSAVRRALELDPNNADAQLAQIFSTPLFGNWVSKEVALRRLAKRNPDHWLAQGRLGVLLYNVGRLSEGIELHRRALTIEPMLPVAHVFLISNLSALGRLQEADALIDRAQDHWPTHPALWMAIFEHRLATGKPQSAAAFVSSPDNLPADFGPLQIEPRLRLARAVETGRQADVEASVNDQLRMARANPAGLVPAAKALALLGRPALAFAVFDSYYSGRGAFAPPTIAKSNVAPQTDVLFSRALATLRADPRFARLLREVGLEEYWRRTGSQPDYRRMA